MARIRPFQALRYDPARVPLGRVVTQPYDKISPAMRERYLRAHPYNLVRILRPLDGASGQAESDVAPYEEAAATLASWRSEGVIRESSAPELFAYFQRFRNPETDQLQTRKGFIGLVHLEDYQRGVVFPHEKTLSAPRRDRLELLRHTRTHFGQVFMMYSDPERRVDGLLDRVGDSGRGVEVADEYGVDHQLWEISEPARVAQIARDLATRPLLIADGHHRYETALAYRDELRAASGTADCGAGEWIMATLVNMESPGLAVLATHRLLSNVPGFDGGELMRRLEAWFEVRPVEAATLMSQLGSFAQRPAIGMVAGRTRAVLLLRPDVGVAELFPDYPPSLPILDVMLLHRLVIERGLGLTEDATRSESHVRYVRDSAEAIASATSGKSQAAFLLRPTPLESVRTIAFSGRVLPQKSTDFFPKLLSGLTMYTIRGSGPPSD